MDIINSWNYVFDNQYFMNDITIVIKTFMRKECLIEVINNWQDYYYNASLIIIDDGPQNNTTYYSNNKNIKYVYIPKYIGLSTGRNLGVSMAKTPFVFISDDDNLPPEPHILHSMYNILSKSNIDIIGSGSFYISIKNKHLQCIEKKTKKNIQICDATLNHFLCKKNNIPKWDDNIHIHCEHIDFFLTCKKENIVVAAYSPLLLYSIKNKCYDINYRKYRFKKNTSYKNYLLKKWNLISMSPWGRK